MPNFCYNVLIIKGTKKRLLKVEEKLFNEEGKFSYSGLIPEPEYLMKYDWENSIRNMTLAMNKQKEDVENYMELLKDGIENGDEVMKEELKCLEECVKNGDTLGWYKWRVDNWGCKWDAGDGGGVTNEGEEIHIAWESPRCPPLKWAYKLIETFPDVEFQLNFEEPGCEFEGDVWSDGEGGYILDEREYVHMCDQCEVKVDGTTWYDEHDCCLCDDCHSILNKKKDE